MRDPKGLLYDFRTSRVPLAIYYVEPWAVEHSEIVQISENRPPLMCKMGETSNFMIFGLGILRNSEADFNNIHNTFDFYRSGTK